MCLCLQKRLVDTLRLLSLRLLCGCGCIRLCVCALEQPSPSSVILLLAQGDKSDLTCEPRDTQSSNWQRVYALLSYPLRSINTVCHPLSPDDGWNVCSLHYVLFLSLYPSPTTPQPTPFFSLKYLSSSARLLCSPSPPLFLCVDLNTHCGSAVPVKEHRGQLCFGNIVYALHRLHIQTWFEKYAIFCAK